MLALPQIDPPNNRTTLISAVEPLKEATFQCIFISYLPTLSKESEEIRVIDTVCVRIWDFTGFLTFCCSGESASNEYNLQTERKFISQSTFSECKRSREFGNQPQKSDNDNFLAKPLIEIDQTLKGS